MQQCKQTVIASFNEYRIWQHVLVPNLLSGGEGWGGAFSPLSGAGHLPASMDGTSSKLIH